MRRTLCPVLLVVLCSCAQATSAYRPTRPAAGEITLSYDHGFELEAGTSHIATGPRYSGLADFVRCVPDARRHAEAAESWGSRSAVLSGFSIGLAATGLGGLAGLGFKDRNDTAMAALLVTGALVEGVAVFLGAASLSSKAQAHGNALDAVSFYNDAVGFSGKTCSGR